MTGLTLTDDTRHRQRQSLVSGSDSEILKIENHFELFYVGNPSPHRKFLKC